MVSTSDLGRFLRRGAAPGLFLALLLLPHRLPGQVEVVPATHPVYDLLRRMEVRGYLHRYRDAILPLSRSEVARFLYAIPDSTADLAAAEQGLLEDLRAEFRFDATGEADVITSVFPPLVPGIATGSGEIFGGRERFLFAHRDSTLTLFVNGLLTVDARTFRGDALDAASTSFLQFGGSFRGTIGGTLGFSLRATNAQFWGSRELLERDPVISQSYALRTADAQNFDNVEASVRFASGIVSLEAARERLLWGYGADQRMILSDNVRTYDFLRAGVEAGPVRYTMVHAWLLGRRSFITFAVPPDTVDRFAEPVVADKYFAGHRLELSFPGVLEAGAQEMVIYSNRSVDLAYLTPLTLIESAQRAREERDNVMWAFDVQTLFLPGVQLHGTAFFDDLHLAEFFSDAWYNRYAWQAGVILADPLGAGGLTLFGEYTRVEPWVFSHNRSRDNDYGSQGRTLGPAIGPNADSWSGRADLQALRNLSLSLRVTRVRQGKNVLSDTRSLVRNVGGDILQPHGESDPLTKTFLDGARVTTTRVQVSGCWEMLPQITLLGSWLYESVSGGEDAGVNALVQASLSCEF
jgi:hypothetical protein